jgi:hypothetical protein
MKIAVMGSETWGLNQARASAARSPMTALNFGIPTIGHCVPDGVLAPRNGSFVSVILFQAQPKRNGIPGAIEVPGRP